MRRVLVTGANGFIGRRLVDLLADKCELYLVDSAKRKKRSDCHWIGLDLRRDFSASLLPDKIEVVIHFAQSRDYRDFPESAVDIFGVNTVSTLKLLELSRQAKVKKFVLASSASVYGGGRKVFREGDLLAPPDDFYAVSKYSAELMARVYSAFMTVIAFRFITVYGPGQQGMLIPNLINRVLKGNSIMISGVSGFRINPIYVDDAVETVIRSLELTETAVLNVGGTEALSILDMGRIIGTVLGKEAKFEFVHDEGARDLVGDISEMKRLLDFTPRVSFEEGVRKTVEGLSTVA